MSKYKEIQTEFRNLDSLKKALSDIGITAEMLQIAQCPQVPSLPMHGYHGDVRPERASVLIDRKHVGGSSNDVGFAWNGTAFVAIISDFDHRVTWTDQRIGLLKQAYANAEIRRQARLRGYSVNEQRRTDGTIALTLVRR